MGKRVKSGRVSPDHRYIQVGELAEVRTDDEMLYVFRKRAWEDVWHFSHRARWDDIGMHLNHKNYPLPTQVKKWADENLGKWEYITGEPEYETLTMEDCVRIQGTFES